MQLPPSVVFKVPPQAFLSLGPRLTHLSLAWAPRPAPGLFPGTFLSWEQDSRKMLSASTTSISSSPSGFLPFKIQQDPKEVWKRKCAALPLPPVANHKCSVFLWAQREDLPSSQATPQQRAILHLSGSIQTLSAAGRGRSFAPVLPSLASPSPSCSIQASPRPYGA